MSKIKIEGIYEANNGDVFLIRKNDFEKHSQEEINNLLKEAQEMYEKGMFEKCEYKKNKNIGSYYLNDEFLGDEQIHILNKFNFFQEGIYLKYNGNLKNFWERH